ncbi:hypothetical protein [Haliscomenobacter hydrossis]|uniref:Outer membrane protein beta-barrel domain-containing protein n=1 Tax=Haliscomenobacter hydrossis (strain ATCC 27775 / DSM 1100 / LMG 10767 / O) TaxID=760192 RepID=F4KSW2_HALH1|nr:hypothetical protein [Haliscomenobacter hydrossis]AEE49069.1 hypothetical protein Halhy_1171 [Haliscomenobacter hydrossis DSM 1100]
MWWELNIRRGGLAGLLLLWASLSYSQIDSCLERLSQASQLYEKGKLSQVIQTLGTCPFDRGQNRVTRRTALNMAAEAYIFMDSTRLAQGALLELLHIDPFYKVNQEIPEMRYLRQQVINYPGVEISGFFGVYLFSKPNFKSAEVFPGATLANRKYSFKGADGDFDIDWGYHAGTEVGLALNRHSRFDLHVGVNISRYSFRYLMELENVTNPTGELDRAALFVAEKHIWLRAPLYLSYNLVPRAEIVNRYLIPYIKFGGSYDHLVRGTAKLPALNLKYSNISVPLVASSQRIDRFRNSNTVSALVGAGLKLHLRRVFFLLDAQYTQTLQSLRKEKAERLVIDDFHYVDNDFTLGNLSLRLGIGVFLFDAKVK